MTESVIITGRDLAIEHNGDEAQPDPKRKRPDRFASSVVPADFRTMQQIVDAGNPSWSDEANDAADASDLSPKRLARLWAGHQIEPEIEHAN